MLTGGGHWPIEQDVADVAGEFLEKLLVKVCEDGLVARWKGDVAGNETIAGSDGLEVGQEIGRRVAPSTLPRAVVVVVAVLLFLLPLVWT